MHAAEYGRVESIKMLLDNGADVRAMDNNEMSSLVIACEEGHADVVKLLVKAGADVNGQDVSVSPWFTILFYAWSL